MPPDPLPNALAAVCRGRLRSITGSEFRALAAGGSRINPLLPLHEPEMVLPAAAADAIRRPVELQDFSWSERAWLAITAWWSAWSNRVRAPVRWTLERYQFQREVAHAFAGWACLDHDGATRLIGLNGRLLRFSASEAATVEELLRSLRIQATVPR